MSYDDSVLLVQMRVMSQRSMAEQSAASSGGSPSAASHPRKAGFLERALLSRHRFGRSGPFMIPLAGTG